MLVTLFSMPSATSTLTSASEWSTSLFDSFFPLLIIILGIGIFMKIFNSVTGSFGGATRA